MFPLPLKIEADKDLIRAVSLSDKKEITFLGDPSAALIESVKDFLNNYPNAPLPPLAWDSVTPFVRRVLEALILIPCGSVRTYKEIAVQIGSPKAARAVGGACGRNPFLFFVPCHRVVSSHGLGGFFYGLECKKEFLNYEKTLIN